MTAEDNVGNYRQCTVGSRRLRHEVGLCELVVINCGRAFVRSDLATGLNHHIYVAITITVQIECDLGSAPRCA